MGFRKLFICPRLLWSVWILLSISILSPHDAQARFCEDNFPYFVYPPMQQALDALESDDDVTVTQVTVGEWVSPDNFYYRFEPVGVNPTIGFIIYPGACVDPGAYAPAAHAIAAEGHLVVIVKMVQDLALLSYTRAGKVIEDHPGIAEWAIGGHSLGGTAACAYTKEPGDVIDGVVMWASYPSVTFSVDDKIMKSLSIYGTNDGLITPEEIEISRLHLPPYTQWEEITGGNHTQFGWYDTDPYEVQPGDTPAGITREAQQTIIINTTVAFLDYFAYCSNDPENDYDNDGICGDVDSCPFDPDNDIDGDNLCGDVDICPYDYNPGQEDTTDGDGAGDACDNCPDHPNGSTLGTCVKIQAGLAVSYRMGEPKEFVTCTSDSDCASTGGIDCQRAREDGDANGCGDVCECYANFTYPNDIKVNLSDLGVLKGEYGRQDCCELNPCSADANGDGKVNLSDLGLLKNEYGRQDCCAPFP